MSKCHRIVCLRWFSFVFSYRRTATGGARVCAARRVELATGVGAGAGACADPSGGGVLKDPGPQQHLRTIRGGGGVLKRLRLQCPSPKDVTSYYVKNYVKYYVKPCKIHSSGGGSPKMVRGDILDHGAVHRC